jgi:DNA-binding MarR family transcriptional regulator
MSSVGPAAGRDDTGQRTSRNLEKVSHVENPETAERAPRPRDLAALVVPLGRALARAEEPVLAAHGLTMWGYAVLLALADQPARSQTTLAAQIRADKTRLIPTLDDLQGRGLIERHPDPADRRVHLLAVTPEGRRTCAQTQSEIQRQEDGLLAQIPPADRATFLRTLSVLSARIREQPS